jgi:hypothetical protein
VGLRNFWNCQEQNSIHVIVRPKNGIIGIFPNKKENQILLIYKEIQNGALAKSYMTNGLLIYGEIFAQFLIY